MTKNKREIYQAHAHAHSEETGYAEVRVAVVASNRWEAERKAEAKIAAWKNPHTVCSFTICAPEEEANAQQRGYERMIKKQNARA